MKTMLQMLGEEERRVIGAIPPEHKTTKQWAEEQGIARVTAAGYIRRLAELGRVKMQRHKIWDGTKTIVVPHYYLVDEQEVARNKQAPDPRAGNPSACSNGKSGKRFTRRKNEK